VLKVGSIDFALVTTDRARYLRQPITKFSSSQYFMMHLKHKGTEQIPPATAKRVPNMFEQS
jgi:hypothetical protein